MTPIFFSVLNASHQRARAEASDEPIKLAARAPLHAFDTQ
jgi:hypothetical protein